MSDQTPTNTTDESTQLQMFLCYFQFFYYLYLIKLQYLPFKLNDAPINDVVMWLLFGSCSETTRNQQPESLTPELHNYDNVNAAPNTWTSQDSPFSHNLESPIKRDGEPGKRRGSEQFMRTYLWSLHSVNDQTQFIPHNSKPMIIHQPENTSDNCEKHVQVAYVHGKLKINFLTSRDQIGTDFKNIRQESNYLLKKRFVLTQSQVHEMSKVFKYQRLTSFDNCQRLASKICLKPHQVSVFVFLF